MSIQLDTRVPERRNSTAANSETHSEVAEYQWVNVTKSAAFTPRDGAGALVFKDRMWLIGGWNNADKKNFPVDCVNDVWSTRTGADWNLEKPNTFGTPLFNGARDWQGRHTAGYVVHNDAMWIIGGDPLQGYYQNDVWFSETGAIWTQVNQGNPVPWGPRALHYTVSFQDRIWVMGGQTIPQYAPASERFYRDIWNSADGLRWEQVCPREPYWSARGMIGGCAVFNGRIWILGGGTYETPNVPERQFLNDVWSSPDGVHWECHVRHAPWSPRQYHDVAVFDGRLWVMEGYQQSGNSNDVWYSADGVHWHELPDTPWDPRHAASLFVYDDALWVVGGNNMESDVWKLIRM